VKSEIKAKENQKETTWLSVESRCQIVLKPSMLGIARHSPSKHSASRPNISSRLHQRFNIIFVAQ